MTVRGGAASHLDTPEPPHQNHKEPPLLLLGECPGHRLLSRCTRGACGARHVGGGACAMGAQAQGTPLNRTSHDCKNAQGSAGLHCRSPAAMPSKRTGTRLSASHSTSVFGMSRADFSRALIGQVGGGGQVVAVAVCPGVRVPMA